MPTSRTLVIEKDEMAEDGFFAGINKLIMYGAHSLDLGSSATALITANDETFSSVTDRAGGLVLAASGADGNVMAIGDIEFLFSPNYTAEDNARFIANIADFLTETDEREYTLAEFPYFYDSEVLDVIYTGTPDLGPSAFDEVIALDNAFEPLGIDVQLASEPTRSNDVLYLGLYNQVGDDVLEILSSENISLTIDPVILSAEELAMMDEDDDDDEDDEFEELIRVLETDIGNIEMSGTALFLLVEDGNQQSLIVLAASTSGLEVALSRLDRDDTTQCSECLAGLSPSRRFSPLSDRHQQ